MEGMFGVGVELEITVRQFGLNVVGKPATLVT
jgi:hypothetical protein